MAKTTSDKLSAVLNSKENIRAAIESQGVPCGKDVPLSLYPEKILSIESGGSGNVMSGAVGVGRRILGVRFDIARVGKYTETSVE